MWNIQVPFVFIETTKLLNNITFIQHNQLGNTFEKIKTEEEICIIFCRIVRDVLKKGICMQYMFHVSRDRIFLEWKRHWSVRKYTLSCLISIPVPLSIDWAYPGRQFDEFLSRSSPQNGYNTSLTDRCGSNVLDKSTRVNDIVREQRVASFFTYPGSDKACRVSRIWRNASVGHLSSKSIIN